MPIMSATQPPINITGSKHMAANVIKMFNQLKYIVINPPRIVYN